MVKEKINEISNIGICSVNTSIKTFAKSNSDDTQVLYTIEIIAKNKMIIWCNGQDLEDVWVKFTNKLLIAGKNTFNKHLSHETVLK